MVVNRSSSLCRLLPSRIKCQSSSSFLPSSSWIYSNNEGIGNNSWCKHRKEQPGGTAPYRRFNFASSQYASCFEEVPVPDTAKLREDAVKYLDDFDQQSWFDDPVCSILNGEKLYAPPSSLWITKNALGIGNGHQYHSTPQQVESLLAHIRTYRSPYVDLRLAIRRIEHQLLTTHAGSLIGNQCLDFAKQDGVTEMEESVMANSIERKLNDALLHDEQDRGKVLIARKPIYVSCVSNFTNFLDLFRKTLRCLELGIPCVILGRSHTVQHSYRWTQLLVQLLKEEGVDLGMITYLSCQLDDIKHITSSTAEATGMLYTTCSRQLAKQIKEGYPNTISSTGGPNTLLTTSWTKPVRDAIRTSASIECAGQCTALRHAVVPESVQSEDVEELFHDIAHLSDPTHALRHGLFDGVFSNHLGTSPPPSTLNEYTKSREKDAYFKLSPTLPPQNEMEEYWRKVVVDVTTIKPTDNIDSLAQWLNHHQPISLAINAPRKQVLELGRAIFEKTSLVVNTIGSTNEDDNYTHDTPTPPAMTCQARPQDAECFGEFPPRKTMNQYTQFPVIIPSSTPSYDTQYATSYLQSRGCDFQHENSFHPLHVSKLLLDVQDPILRGYCMELLDYLIDVTSHNPKRGFGSSRTALWGIQRPPMMDGLRTILRCGGLSKQTLSFEDILPILLVFYATNARSQLELSVEKNQSVLLDALERHNIADRIFDLVVEDDSSFDHRVTEVEEQLYNVTKVDGPMTNFPMLGQFVSLYLPMGHVKSTMKDDEEFVEYFGKSEKWLQMDK